MSRYSDRPILASLISGGGGWWVGRWNGVSERGEFESSGRGVPAAAERVRLDVWLWAVRLFKTRSLAAEACRLGRVTRTDGEPVKPSRPMRAGDEVFVREEFLVRRLRVERVLERRVGAKLVAAHMSDLTPLADVERARALRLEQRLTTPVFVPGAGRPTKAQRRALEAWHRAGEGEEGGGMKEEGD